MTSKYEIFCTVVECGGFTEAARQLNYSQSAVSQAVRTLEQELGVRLISRERHRLTLTKDGKTYLPFTYFSGSTPDNNYTPTQPYTLVIESNHVSNEESGYMKLFIPCGGADSPRPIKLRQRGSDGKWFLWEQYLLTGVRTPKSEDPWA